MTLRQFLYLFYKAGDDMVNHDGIEHAGYLSFLSLLALFPFLVFLTAIAGFIGESEIGIRFVGVLLDTLPDDVTKPLRPRIHEIVSGPPQGLLTIAIVGAIWTASSAVEGLRTVLNRAYRVATPPAYPLRRAFAIVELLILTVAVMTGMFLLIFSPLIMNYLTQFPEIDQFFEPLFPYFRFAASAVLLFLVVTSLYYFLPNIKQRWIRTAPGAAIVVGLWMGGATLFSTYLHNFDQVNIIYGSLEGFIAALLFFYIMNMIFIYGAEFNYSLDQALGRTIEQKEAGGEQKEFDF